MLSNIRLKLVQLSSATGINDPMYPMYKVFAVLPALVLLFGCTGAATHPQQQATLQAHPVTPSHATIAVRPPDLTGSGSSIQTCQVPALIMLWRRRQAAPSEDLPVGPGDVIDISVPEIDELQNQKIRVSAQGRVELPLVGAVDAAGLSESELHDALVRKLKIYMKEPRVELFVENYRSRGVAVMGAVQKPGYYDLADEHESLESMIGLAGGLASGAAQMVVFSPAQPGGGAKYSSVSGHSDGLSRDSETTAQGWASPGSQSATAVSDPPAPIESTAVSSSASPFPAEHSNVLNIDAAGDAGCLGLPARPGDVIIVPVAGEVMVEGWVQNPGAFAITPGMTVLGAVSAAGGPVFSWRVELIRANPAGGKTVNEYSLSHLQSGQEPDPPVQSGDVLLVEKSVVGAVPYSLFEIFSHFGTGVGIPIP